MFVDWMSTDVHAITKTWRLDTFGPLFSKDQCVKVWVPG